MIAPGMARRSSATITINPAPASNAAGAFRSPSVTSVSRLAVMMPASFSAMIPRNSPIPAEIAIFCERGMASTIHAGGASG